MAERVFNEEPLSSSRSAASVTRYGPVPVKGEPADVAGLLPEHATQKPLGQWPRATLRELRRGRREERIRATVDRVKPVVAKLQERLDELRHRFGVVRGRIESGELQEELRSRASYYGDEVTRRAREARARTEAYANEKPLQFIAGVAVAGFAIGFLLRMGRDE
jgi:ElaB/YqjD/DUF883 family membrane-anchored ribosome-binding protein